MATPSASSIANAISARTTAQTRQAQQAQGASPLVAGYQQWVGGSGMPAGLPRPLADFLTGAFGPLSPISPMPIDEPREDSGRPRPRRWEYPVGWNLPVGQPGQEGFKLAPFSVLRDLADRYSVVRAMLDIRINEMAGLEWDIGPTADAQQAHKGDKAAGKDQKERSAQIVRWFKKIDTNYKGFQSWFTACLEDQHVVDAVSLHVLPTRVTGKGLFGADLAELELLAGETIRPLLNIRGARPRPPAPAYQQYLWGVPRADLMEVMTDRDLDHMADRLDEAGVEDYDLDPHDEFRADELLYLPRWQRSWTPYGFSSIEKALLPITIGLNRQNFLLDYFTEGTIPGVYVIAGDQYVTPAQQRQLQDSLNALAGDTAWKHRVIVLPPGSTTDPQKDLAWQKDVDQNIIEQVAMILHIQPHEIGMVPGGRSSGLGGKGMAEAQTQAIVEQRTQPDRKWWKETVFDWVIQRVFKQEDLEFKWMDFEEEEDAGTKATSQTQKVHGGLSTIDQERVEDGLDPFNLPLTQTPFLFAGGAVIPLDPNVPAPVAPGQTAMGPDGKPLLDADGNPIPVPKGNPFGDKKPGEDGPPGKAGAKPKPPFGGPKAPAAAPAGGSVPPAAPQATPAKAAPTAAAPAKAEADKPDAKPAADAKPDAKATDKPDPNKTDSSGEAAGDDTAPKTGLNADAPDLKERHGPITESDKKAPEPGSHGADSDHEAGDPVGPQAAVADARAAADDAKGAAKDKDANRAAKDAGRAADDAEAAAGPAKGKDTGKPKDKKKGKPFGGKIDDGFGALTVADLVKGKIKYKGDLTDVVYRYLLRSYPKDAVKWVRDGGEWEYDPHVDLKDINMARRPGGRNPDKVHDIGETLDDGASMDPVVLVRRDPPNGYEYDIADGWHRCLGAEHADWKDIPAFIGSGFDDKADWGLEMQDVSDSVKKAAMAELAVLRRFIRKDGNKVENFRTTAIDSDVMRLLAVDLTTVDRDAALELARGRIVKGGNPGPLREWYNDGADGQIDWGSDGDFDQCVGVASGYMADDDAKGFCNLRHQDATGVAPGQEKIALKYSDDQPRDLNGRWTTDGYGGGPEPGERIGRQIGTMDHFDDEEHASQVPVHTTSHGRTVAVRPISVSPTGGGPLVSVVSDVRPHPGFQPGTGHWQDLGERGLFEHSQKGAGAEVLKDFSVGGGVSGSGVQLVPFDLDTGPRPKTGPVTCPRDGLALVDGECPVHGTAVLKYSADQERDEAGRWSIGSSVRVTEGHRAGRIGTVVGRARPDGQPDSYGTHVEVAFEDAEGSRHAGIGLYHPSQLAADKVDKVDKIDLLSAIDAELARRGIRPIEKGTPLHGWENVPEGRRTRKAKRPAGMAPGIAGVERDGKRYGVGVGKDDDGVFVHTHRVRSDSYPDLDAIPTKALEFVDSTGAATSDLNKYSPDQPRDDHGRFTDAGGGWSSSFAPRDSVDTMGAFYHDGKWDPQRLADVHNPAVAGILAGVVPATGAPTVYMTGGGYGSGKSTLLEKFPGLVGFPNDPTAAAKVDPDAIKNLIPEYKVLASPENRDPGAATFVHEESSAISKEALAEALDKNMNAIYDTSGDTGPEKLADKVAGMRADGAGRVIAAYAFPGSITEAQSRADYRAENSGGLRRYVDPGILTANHHEVANCWLQSAQNGVFDNLTLWSTDHPFGDPPTLIASAANGAITVSDQKAFDAFKELAK